MSNPAPVRFEGVRKRFGSTEVLRGIDLAVASGECLVLLGPSGCGKTTLLRLVAGLEKVDSGRIVIGERAVDDVAPAERDIAMVFQNYALYPHLSAFENVAFPLRARRMPPAQLEERVRGAARRLGIEALLQRRPAELSGGQQQRVALARALVREPAVFLMDEPLSNLDAQLRFATRTELKRLQQELGTTTLYVTHDQAEAMTLGSRIALLRGGMLEQVGAPLDLYRRPANRFVASFLGSPAINFLPQPGGSDDIEIGVRPEDILLGGSPAPGYSAGDVITIEPMGNETLVALQADGARVTARTTADFSALPGERLYFKPAAGKTLRFDRRTGNRIEADQKIV
jgi:ABC-type sugar transport system ATPase subunit